MPASRRYSTLLFLLFALCAWSVWSAAIWSHFSNIPFFDEWFFLKDLDAYVDGRASLLQVALAPHCEHRMVASKLLLCLLGPAIDLDLRLVCLASFLVAGASLTILLVKCRADICTGIVILSAFMSLDAWENWIWAWQLQVHSALFLGITGLWLHSRAGEEQAAAIGTVSLMLSGLSYAAGFGFACAAILLRLSRRQWRSACTVACVAVVVVVAHYLSLPAKAFQVGIVPPERASSAIAFLVDFMANPLVATGAGNAVTQVIGIVGLAAGATIMVACLLGKLDLRLHFSAGLCVAGLAAGCAIALGRGLDSNAGMVSRYANFSNLAWIGIIVTLIQVLATRSKVVTTTAFVGLVTWSSVAAYPDLLHRSTVLRASRAALATGEGLTFEIVRATTPDIAALSLGLSIARKHGWCDLQALPLDLATQASLRIDKQTDPWRFEVEGVPSGNVAQLIARLEESEVVLWTGPVDEQGNTTTQIAADKARLARSFVLRWLDHDAALREVDAVDD